MKISYIELLGKQYPLCFSLSAAEKLSEQFGDLNKLQETLASGDTGEVAKAADVLLSVLMEAGRVYCTIAGIEQPEPLPCRPSDLIDVSDPTALTSIFLAISAGNEREVEAVSKNAEATQSE